MKETNKKYKVKIKFNNYGEVLKNRIESTGRDIIIKNNKQLKELVKESFINKNLNIALHLGRLNSEIIYSIKCKIINIPQNKENLLNNKPYDLIINQSEIRHLVENKLNLTINDVIDFIKRVPDIIINNDCVVYSKNEKNEGLRFKKYIMMGHIFLLY